MIPHSQLDKNVLVDAYRMDETVCIENLLLQAELPEDVVQRIQKTAKELVIKVREARIGKGGIDAFLATYDLSSQEGIALMCLAEALLRIPDAKTVDLLIKDKISDAGWEKHLGRSSSLFVNAATWGLMLSGKIMHQEDTDSNQLTVILKRLLTKTGEPVIRTAIAQAMKILGNQFVMGVTIEDAIKRARSLEAKGFRYSYDMLGEAAKTAKDAETYFNAYLEAIRAIGEASQNKGPIEGPGVSIKLSALHPRYEYIKKTRVWYELLPRLKQLVLEAKKYNIGLTIDAEEAERLELSLELIEMIMSDPLLENWTGFGLAVQAYQKRAPFVIDSLIHMARHYRRPLMIRLVKGAYWDSEIKWAQERGLSGYPVFTRKASTDVSYRVCMKKLLDATDIIYPQFATHNAYTVATVLELKKNNKFEFQCLHGMGDALYSPIVGKDNLNVPCRIYAPVGSHETLLAYLVRRLLENGANSSFVNQILDENIPIEDLIEDPVHKTIVLSQKPHPAIPLPSEIYGHLRPNSKGLDITHLKEMEPVLKVVQRTPNDQWMAYPSVGISNNQMPLEPVFNPADRRQQIGAVAITSDEQLEESLKRAHEMAISWEETPIETRAGCLQKMAVLLEEHKPELMSMLVHEGGKTIIDANAEVREAVDFCWYYSQRCFEDFTPKVLPGPTGEYNQLVLHGRGPIACISPWNFPLAIFLGQVTAALAAGNTVIAKPASQTPLIAARAIQLLHEAGVLSGVVQMVTGGGARVGNRLVNDKRIQGVMFTGSTETACHINQLLAARKGPIVPFIAETGGQNAMIVDSSALPEQVVTDAIVSAFGSAGQRCSALRVLFVQEEVSDKIIEMLQGAMSELKIGNPIYLDTDIGPVIDTKAKQTLQQHADHLSKIAKCLYRVPLDSELEHGTFFAPHAFEIDRMNVLEQEVFGPVLHVIRYQSNALDKVIEAINGTGYGLTLGIHSRIEESIQYIHRRIRVGNTYVNRSMIGAVVGVQPFGGQGLSGTGPKAGGPHYLTRLATEKTLSINTTAAGGNTTLVALAE